jgi:hypothetical protein
MYRVHENDHKRPWVRNIISNREGSKQKKEKKVKRGGNQQILQNQNKTACKHPLKPFLKMCDHAIVTSSGTL